MMRRMWNVFKRLARWPSRRIYLDYAAATPLRPAVARAMAPYFTDHFANPSAIHAEGQRARGAVEGARERVAALLGVRAEEITFTSGGTEANNLALFGVVEAAHAQGRAYEEIEIMSTAIEHPSILEALQALSRRGVCVRYVPIDRDGLVDREAFEAMLSARTLLVTMAYANSEVGTVQRIKQLARMVRAKTGEAGTATYFHTDASQAPLWLSCSLTSLGVDLLTLDAGKCYGPKGVGVLAHKKRVPIAPYLLGGDQERGLRPGTENVPLVVGCAEALAAACEGYAARAQKVATLRDRFIAELEAAIPQLTLNGARQERIANNCNISIPGVDGEFAVVTLDVHGIAASTRSACAGGQGSGSHVVRAMTGDDARAASTIRFTLGEETTWEELVATVQTLAEHVAALQDS